MAINVGGDRKAEIKVKKWGAPVAETEPSLQNKKQKMEMFESETKLRRCEREVLNCGKTNPQFPVLT